MYSSDTNMGLKRHTFDTNDNKCSEIFNRADTLFNEKDFHVKRLDYFKWGKCLHGVNIESLLCHHTHTHTTPAAVEATHTSAIQCRHKDACPAFSLLLITNQCVPQRGAGSWLMATKSRKQA